MTKVDSLYLYLIELVLHCVHLYIDLEDIGDASSSWNWDNIQLLVVTTFVTLIVSLQSFYWVGNV